MAFDHPPTYQYQPWSATERRDSAYWSMDTSASTASSAFNTSRSPSVQPMSRYLQEQDRPLFTTADLGQDPLQPYPNISEYALKCVPSDGSLYSRRFPSPSYSGLSSSQLSSHWGEREITPWSSPDVGAATYSPETGYLDSSGYSLGRPLASDGQGFHDQGACVALHDVQQYADAQPEQPTFENDHLTYGSFAQEGYQPIRHDEDGHFVPVAYVPSQPDKSEPVNGQTAEAGPSLRRRRASQPSRSVTAPHSPSKVSKRPSFSKRSSSHQTKAHEDSDTNNAQRSFPCPFATYGCESVFGSKNEWKRHINTQHIRLGYWRCEHCPNSDRKPNDFNRKDLFIQHVRRMHPIKLEKAATKNTKTTGSRARQNDPEEQVLANVAMRCYRKLRSPPDRSGCLFCDARFEGCHTWEERLEHVGKHMEATKKDGDEPIHPRAWQIDEDLEAWLQKENLIVRHKGHWTLAER